MSRAKDILAVKGWKKLLANPASVMAETAVYAIPDEVMAPYMERLGEDEDTLGAACLEVVHTYFEIGTGDWADERELDSQPVCVGRMLGSGYALMTCRDSYVNAWLALEAVKRGTNPPEALVHVLSTGSGEVTFVDPDDDTPDNHDIVRQVEERCGQEESGDELEAVAANLGIGLAS